MKKKTSVLLELFNGNTLRGNLLRSGVGSLVLRLSAVMASVICSIVLARVLSPAGFGNYAYTFAILSVMSIPVQLGIPILILRETAQAHAQSNWSLMKGIWWWGSTRIIVASIVVITISAIVVFATAVQFEREALNVFLIGLPLIPLMALGRARGAALRGLQRVVQGQFPEDVLRPSLLVLFTVVPYWLFAGQVSPSHVMQSHVMAAIISFVVGAVLLVRARPSELTRSTERFTENKTWLRAVFPLAFISGMQLINQQADLLMLGVLRSAEETGLYKVAISGASLAVFGLQVVNMVIAPHFARLYVQEKMDLLSRLVSVAAIGGMIATLPIVVIFIVWGSEILSLMYGLAYIESYMPLVILSLGKAISVFFGLTAVILAMSGYEKKAAYVLVITALMNVFLNAVLIPVFGVSGAAMATSFSVVFSSFIFWRVIKNNLGIDSSIIPLINSFFIKK